MLLVFFRMFAIHLISGVFIKAHRGIAPSKNFLFFSLSITKSNLVFTKKDMKERSAPRTGLTWDFVSHGFARNGSRMEFPH